MLQLINLKPGHALTHRSFVSNRSRESSFVFVSDEKAFVKMLAIFSGPSRCDLEINLVSCEVTMALDCILDAARSLL
jgi:hypothetical protein